MIATAEYNDVTAAISLLFPVGIVFSDVTGAIVNTSDEILPGGGDGGTLIVR